jgi:G-patch domain
MDIDKYDDYVRGPVREVVTVDTKIKSTNKGFEMLSKLGWVEGQPLGLSQDGVPFPPDYPRRSCKVRIARIDPIPFHVKSDATGLGKTSQDFRMIETTVSQRRELDSERQINETEEQRKAREVSD